MRTLLVVAVALISCSLCVRAQEAPAGAASKPPAIDFNLPVLKGDKKPLIDCRLMILDVQNQETAEHLQLRKDICADNASLRAFSHEALKPPTTQRQAGSTASSDEHLNAVLGWKIDSATAPLDLSPDERTRLNKALWRSLALDAAYAACRVIAIDPEKDCKQDN